MRFAVLFSRFLYCHCSPSRSWFRSLDGHAPSQFFRGSRKCSFSSTHRYLQRKGFIRIEHPMNTTKRFWSTFNGMCWSVREREGADSVISYGYVFMTWGFCWVDKRRSFVVFWKGFAGILVVGGVWSVESRRRTNVNSGQRERHGRTCPRSGNSCNCQCRH